MDPLITSNIKTKITERNPLCKMCRELFLKKEEELLRQWLKLHKECVYKEKNARSIINVFWKVKT